MAWMLPNGLNKKTKMTKTKLLIAAAILSIGFTACNNESDTAKQDAELLSIYVDSVDNLKPVYTTEHWTLIENGYQNRAFQSEKTSASLNATDKAKAAASKEKYEALKIKYETNIKESEAAAAVPNFKTVLRDRLFGEGKVGDDMKFLYVTSDNIRGIYQNFVDVVADNKKNYSREDWDEIKVLYEALDTRKNVVEKELTGKDNMKIAGLKIKFASIYSTHRVVAKVRENSDAKQ